MVVLDAAREFHELARSSLGEEISASPAFAPHKIILRGAKHLICLGGKEIALLTFLALGASVGGNAVWSWLLRHLPASTVGLTGFLNPPLTLTSKFLLATFLPASFAFSIA